MIEKTLRVNLLLDFYSSLLTKKQVEYIELYFKNDYSLSEIADIFNVSRNAIYDNITRSIKQLENYELKLQLIHKFKKRKNIYEKIKNEYKDTKLLEYISDLENFE